MRRILILCACFQLSSGIPGREFVNIFPHRNGLGSEAKHDITIAASSSSSPTSVKVLVYNTEFQWEFPLKAGQMWTISLPAQVELSGTISLTPVLVEADNEVSVLTLNCDPDSCTASLLFPVSTWGNNYYTVTPQIPEQDTYSQIFITNHLQNNTVDVYVTGEVTFQDHVFSQGEVLSFTMGPFESVKLQSPQSLSGTRIISQKVVGVASGYTCISQSGQTCSSGFLQLLPTPAWGTAYLVPPLPAQSTSDVLYLVTYATTKLEVQDNLGQHIHTFSSGLVVKVPVNPSSALSIRANKGIQVIYFCSGSSGGGARLTAPFMMALLPTDRFCPNFAFAAKASFQNSAVLVAEGSSGILLRYDGAPPTPELYWHRVMGTDFSWGVLPIQSPGDHVLHQLDGEFGVYIIGTTPDHSYGYPGLCAGEVKDPCEVVRCGFNRRCVIRDEKAMCISDSEACSAWGDPHYQTFDGTAFHFQGTCAYTMTQTHCQDLNATATSPPPPVFSVQTANDNTGDPRESSVRMVRVTLQGVSITMTKEEEQPQVRINGTKRYLPCTLGNGTVRLYQSGLSAVVLETSFGLAVRYDWSHSLVIDLSRELAGHVCGLCGNFNGNASDDFLVPSGMLAQGVDEFGQSWKVSSKDCGKALCRDGCCACWPQCDSEQEVLHRGPWSCGLLENRLGPFQGCLPVIDPAPYISGCLNELCAFQGDGALLCRVLKTYADTCQRAGATVLEWRGVANCSMVCPENSHYDPCGSSCPATCADPDAPSGCQSSCVESCQCDTGFLLSAEECVPHRQCGCSYQGFYYPANYTFWADDQCQQRCTCQPGTHQVTCTHVGCQPNEVCKVVNDTLDCHMVGLGACSAVGDPYYTTFDGRQYDFDGSCLYEFVATCPRPPGLLAFEILVQNEISDDKNMSSSKTVRILVHGYRIELTREYSSRVLVNGILMLLPSVLSNGKVKMYMTGLAASVETDFGLVLMYNWNNHVTITVPNAYSGSLCGLCGNYNGDPTDDLMMPNGQLTTDPSTFGESWKTDNVAECRPKPLVSFLVCKAQKRDVFSNGTYCGKLIDHRGPFRECHPIINPRMLFESCVQDVCLSEGSQFTLCSFLTSYVASCQANRAVIYSWRSSQFCDLPCPANSRYVLCSSTHPASCVQSPGPSDAPCREDCHCLSGFVRSGDRCVPDSECGCFYDGVYYQSGVTFYPDAKCQRLCTCGAGRRVLCQPSSCSQGEECSIKEGVRKCTPVGTCSVSGGRHFLSFDGHAFDFQGTCVYTLASSCPKWGAEGALEPFSLRLHQGKVELEIYGMNFSVSQGQNATVQVDGVTWNVPIILDRVRVIPHGLNLRLETEAKVGLIYDLRYYLTVVVPGNYRAQLCGLCGNFNGIPADDLRLPDGQRAQDAQVLGASWKVPVLGLNCNDSCGDACPRCDHRVAANFRSERFCGFITATKGPFATCHPTIAPQPFFNDCVQELCQADQVSAQLCLSLTAYTAACQEAGVKIQAWRTEALCSLVCPSSSQYKICAQNCPSSCVKLDDQCPQTCAEGCECDPGLQFSGDRCVAIQNCGCSQGGRYHKPADVVWEENCTKKCTCSPSGGLECETATCKPGTECSLRNGTLDCYPRSGKSCTDVSCTTNHQCQILRGQPVCVQETWRTAECWVLGGPYYHTFDGLDFDFQGNCTYILVQKCGQGGPAPFFSVQVTNEHLPGNNRASLSAVHVMVSGDNVTVLRQEVGFVRVNGLKSPLPLSLSSGGMRLSQRGWSVAVETNFSLSLLYNWDQLVVVTLPSFYADVCGLCGNNNGDPSDDLETPDGSQASIPAFSWSWKVDNGDPSCQADCSGPCVSCKPYIASRYSTDSFCGLLSSKDGPFGGCNAVVNPNIYDKICVNDLCINDGNQTFLCRAVEAYAAACQIKGLDTLDWRNRTRCYLQCPMFSHYEPCGSSCTATCANPDAPSGCQSSCVESCQCDVGFLLSADECVPRGQCGCSYQGSYYPANYTFWADDQCQQRCTCDPQTNQLTCTQSSCKPLESCGLVGGVRGCQAIAVQSCLSEGGRHYVTFDGLAYDFQGSCVYHLAVLCSLSTNLTAFAVQIFKGIEDTAAVTVIIHMYGVAMEISSDRSGKIKVDGVFKDLPYNLNTDQVMLYDTGLLVFMQTNFGLSLTLDVHNRLTLAVPSVYSGSLCGLCGNYNGNSTDDLTTRNGQLAADPFEFGKSWKARDVPGCVDGCKGPCAVCSETQKQMFLGTGYCGKLTDPAGPFRDCHGTVDPARILQNCVSDACVHKSIQYVLCQSFAYYVAACQDLGAKVYKWRTSSFCNLACPVGSSYALCSDSIPVSCSSFPSPVAMPCRENCLCNQGLLLSGGTCVQQWRCGCLHDGYHQVGKSFYTAQCAQSCTCKLGGKVQCEASPCNGHEECRLENGVLGCYPHPRNGQCSLSGGVHLVSFDGHAFDLQGTCFYTLATYCPLEAEGGSLQPFSVRVRSNKSWQGSRILGDTVVEVEVGGRNYTLVTRLDGKIKVDGVLETLPFSDGQMHIYRQGVQVLVRTQSSVSIRFDLQYNLVVLVPEPYWALLCGLCGNFNGNPSDDLQLPDGQLARDTQALATSWKVPVHGLHCTDGCGDACPRCVPSVETKFSSDSYCGLIMASSGPFAACHPTVLPQPFFNNCVHDLCQAGGASGPFCGSLTAYTAACQEAGVNIQSWRSESLCPLTCSESGRYSLCVEPCLFVCDEVGSLLDCQSNCTEGCACREGYVFNGDSCIAVEECSCFKDGRRYEPGEERLLDNCTLSCTCSPPLIQCQPHTCSGSQTCFVLNGTMGCHSQDPCKEQCGPSQSCEWTEGKPVCVDQASGTCWTWGDPHYHTLDGWDFDFQGTCAYVLAATQPNAQGLEPFSVSQKNENHGNKLVSFVREVSVTVRGKTVSIIWQELGTVRVNGAIAYLPLTLLEGLVRVNQVGESVVLETDFGLRVMYDRGTTLLVSLAKVYRGKVNGLCGNFNGEPLDEMSVGTKISVEQWADKWRVNDGDQLCCTSCQGVWQTCGPNEEALYGHKLYCGALTQLFGPFAQCHDEVSPDPFFRGCKFDLCHHKGARQILCKALEAYVAVCWQKGIVVKDWRSAYRCSISCPPHSHYNDCGTMCPPTCGVRGIATCVNVCVEGCFCDDGYQKSPLGCVNRCGCTYNGQYYQPGVSFWSPDNCLQHCVCNPRNGSVLCKDSRCTANQKCMLSGGIWGCYPIRFNCTIMGSLHFLAFDHRAFDFQGSCSYRLVGVCSQDPQLIPFEIHWGNNSCDACLHHCSSLSLEVYQMLLSIHKDSPRRVQVNGIHRTLPYKFQENKIMVYHSPSSVVMETDFGLQVVLHWSSTLTVFLPSTYSGVTCGLCGNANSDPIDDLLTPSGMLAQSVEEFGCSWKVAGVAECKSPCTSGPKQCTMEETQLFERGLYCGVLLNDMGPFAPCFQVVDPLPYFHNCINDACSYGGHFTALCSSIASYVAACQAAKVPVREWRRDTFCGAMCPENSKYELCGSGCPETCYKLSSPEHCSAPCQEGCQCDNGFALSDGQCVPILQCGCVYQGQYHAQGLFYPEGGCRLLCNCSEGGAVQCTQASCGSQERCALEEGVWQCVPVGYSTCLTLGATGYITFDGYSFVTQGVCSYILAQSREPGLATFSVLVRMEKAKNEAPQLREVVVLLEGSIVEIHYARLWNVRVNGEDFSLPWRPQGGEIWALQEGGYSSVILQTAFGLEIRFTSTRLLWLTVPSTYQNHLSGLCGNYNGLGSDDLVLPNGIRAPSVPAFVSSWTQAEEGQVCDGCDEDCPQCNTTQLDEHSGKLKCGMLTSVYGPFSTCRVLVDSQLYFKLCVAGLCITGGAHAVLCQALEAYSSACRSKGGKIGQWREHFSCSLSCPDVSSPSSCLGSCSLSCAEMMQPPVCGEGCVEGCQCDHGNLFSGKECVPIGNCGCVYNGRYIKMNEKLYNEDCTKWCWCHPLGGVLCEPVACGPDETCALRDGVRGCQASAKMCHLLQGSLLHSFYGMQMSLTPGSPYELSFLCDPTDDRWFRVVAYRGICGFSPGTTLHIFLGLVVIVTQNGIVKVNGRQVTLPLNVTPEIFLGQDGQKGIVVRRGSEVEVRLDFGSDTVTLQLSPWYAGKLCGACGNHNPSDDLNESVESWVAKKFPGCDING